MKTIRSWFTPNPILVKELRSRMRGSRAFITLTVALLGMALMMLGLVSLLTSLNRWGGGLLSPQVGQVLFMGLVNFELLMVCAVTPALTAGALSSEREKLTYEMLLATPLGPLRLVWGKLISALSYVFLLIFAAIPLASLVFLFGGVAPLELVKGLLVLVMVTITFGIYGLFLSALLGRTGRATVISFLTVAALSVGPLLAMFVSAIFGNSITLPRGLLAISPVSMLISAVTPSGSTNSGSITGLFSFLAGQWDPSLNPEALVHIPRPIYHYSLAIYGGLTILLFVLTLALVHPSRRFYLPRRTALVSATALAAFAGLVIAAYLVTAPRYEWVQAPADAAQSGVPMPANGIAVARPVPAATGPGTPTPTVITASGAAMPLETQAAIYAAAARQAYLNDNPGANATLIYMLSITNDHAGDPNQPDAGAAPLSAELQKSIAAQLSDLPARLAWVSGLDSVAKDAQSGKIGDGGVVLTFGNIQVQSDGSVQVPLSIFLSNQAAGGQTYCLQKSGDGWKVTGISGARWTY